jgi:hypothetical protein
MSIEPNPYAAPAADLGFSPFAPAQAGEAEQIRRRYIKHEVSVQSIGVLYYLGGGMMALASFGLLVAAVSASKTPAVEMTIGIFYGLFAAAFITVGRGLRTLRPWVRIPVGILSGIGLLGVPLGTLINGYILYLIFCEKGSTVFSPQYAEVIRQTPHVKYRTALWLWILLAVLIAIVVVVIVSALTFGK